MPAVKLTRDQRAELADEAGRTGAFLGLEPALTFA
jgi:hypothetical protein